MTLIWRLIAYGLETSGYNLFLELWMVSIIFFALNSYINVKGWRDHTFGHELAHAIDLELNLTIGFRWELGFQNPKSPNVKSNAPVKNPKYLPFHNESPTTRRYLHSDHALMSIFPCLSEDHPDYKEGDHAYSPPEIQANITQMRSRINRAYTANDVVTIRKNAKLKYVFPN